MNITRMFCTERWQLPTVNGQRLVLTISIRSVRSPVLNLIWKWTMKWWLAGFTMQLKQSYHRTAGALQASHSLRQRVLSAGRCIICLSASYNCCLLYLLSILVKRRKEVSVPLSASESYGTTVRPIWQIYRAERSVHWHRGVPDSSRKHSARLSRPIPISHQTSDR